MQVGAPTKEYSSKQPSTHRGKGANLFDVLLIALWTGRTARGSPRVPKGVVVLQGMFCWSRNNSLGSTEGILAHSKLLVHWSQCWKAILLYYLYSHLYTLCMYVCVCARACIHARVHMWVLAEARRGLVSYLAWMLRTKLWSSIRIASAQLLSHLFSTLF